MNLLQMMESPYPKTPGFKRTDTSYAAAQAIKPSAGTLRASVLAELRNGSGTADELAERLHIDKLSIRPRCSELREMRKILDTGERRLNASMKRAIVWRAA